MPSQLPPNFPPMASSPNIVGMDASGKMTFSMPEYQAAVDVAGTNVAMTPLPPKQAFDAATVAPGPGYQPRAPAVDDSRLHVRTAVVGMCGCRSGTMLKYVCVVVWNDNCCCFYSSSIIVKYNLTTGAVCCRACTCDRGP